MKNLMLIGFTILFTQSVYAENDKCVHIIKQPIKIYDCAFEFEGVMFIGQGATKLSARSAAIQSCIQSTLPEATPAHCTAASKNAEYEQGEIPAP